MAEVIRHLPPSYLKQQRENRWLADENPWSADYKAIYEQGKIEVGWPEGAESLYETIGRDNTICILGAQLGDEGKGRFVDNTLQTMLNIPGIKSAYVIRFQGGANAGHTVYKDNPEDPSHPIKVPLHQIPSSMLEPRAVGIMESGMVIHMADLKTEIEDGEKIVGDLQGKLLLSQDAILCTDLERAEEVLNRVRSGGNSDGGTSRGMSPSYSRKIDRTGMLIKDLFADNWKDKLNKYYDELQADFRRHGIKLSEVTVPDLRATRDSGTATSQSVGTKKEFFKKLEEVRKWYISRDQDQPIEKKMIQNTFLVQRDLKKDMSKGVLFEGAQAIGLDSWLGRFPDVGSSVTTLAGIGSSSKIWTPDDIKQTIGIFKIPYMSSVGAKTTEMATQIKMPKENKDEVQLTQDQQYAAYARKEGHEYGTTTGRPRDICYLDLEMMRFNINAGGIEMLAGTHLDIAEKNRPIKVCTHYTSADGKTKIPYQPGLEYQKNVKPHYVELPGWDGAEVRAAKSFDELPIEAKQFLAFIQRQTGTPIVSVTTGPERQHLIEIPTLQQPDEIYLGAQIPKKGTIFSSN